MSVNLVNGLLARVRIDTEKSEATGIKVFLMKPIEEIKFLPVKCVSISYSPLIYHSLQVSSEVGPKLLILTGNNAL
jgi:hypothetical protein